MSQQSDLFSPPPADEADVGRAGVARAREILATAERDRGMAQAEDNAPPGWNDEAFAFIDDYLRSHEVLFCDDLWLAGLSEPPNPKALGPVILRAARAGLMTKSGDYRPSVSSHGIPKPIWRSLIFQGATP